jgi:hypothetical protein
LELKIVNSNDIGYFYKLVNKNTCHKTGIGPLKAPNGEWVLENSKKAEMLNNYYVSMCTTDDGVSPPLPDIPLDSSLLDKVLFSPALVYKALKSVKRKNTSGPDGLPSILFNKLAPQLSNPLSKIYNVIMQKGMVPNVWKRAIVIPIFKKGVSAEPKNYRPISLTCSGSKIFESVIKSVLIPFLENKNLLSPDQHGFRAKHSTCLNLLECQNDWTTNLDSKADTLVAHIDFARAFDSVSLPKLIQKLQNAGINGNLLNCIKSMLCGRLQQVKVGNSLSDLKPVSSGVPQGSVLGPVLFIFFINDITKVVLPPTVPKLYADDLKIYCLAKNDNDIKTFQESLDNVTKWAETWQLPISKEKSKWLLISNKKCVPKVEYNFELAGVSLPRVKEVLDLGVNFNGTLNFTNHISIIITKAKNRLFLLRKIFKSKNPHLLILGFKTYVMPLLEYCSQVWNPQIDADVRRIESVQRMFTKRLAGYNTLNYPERLKKSGLQTLELRRLRADMCLCYNILHGNLETETGNFFEVGAPGITRGHNWKLKNRVPRLNLRLHYFCNRVVNAWNALQPETVNASSIATFRHLLEKESFVNYLTINL